MTGKQIDSEIADKCVLMAKAIGRSVHRQKQVPTPEDFESLVLEAAFGDEASTAAHERALKLLLSPLS